MQLKEKIYSFIQQPFPLWENRLTELLVQKKWEELRTYGINKPNEYSTSRALFSSTLTPLPTSTVIFNGPKEETINLEAPSFDLLERFYSEHGLEPLLESEIESTDVLSKLANALAMLKLVEPAYLGISKLVRSIQVLRQEDAEIDTSYSHPKIPFSIFVTVCEDDTTLYSLRVAESILHEAMHLKLTLIEEVVPLVQSRTKNLYYSPWRDEERPIQGVLHGLFVFRAIFNFFELLKVILNSNEVIDYLNVRTDQVKEEINQLKDFGLCADLTIDGANLVTNLLPLN